MQTPCFLENDKTEKLCFMGFSLKRKAIECNCYVTVTQTWAKLGFPKSKVAFLGIMRSEQNKLKAGQT